MRRAEIYLYQSTKVPLNKILSLQILPVKGSLLTLFSFLILAYVCVLCVYMYCMHTSVQFNSENFIDPKGQFKCSNLRAFHKSIKNIYSLCQSQQFM